MTDDATGFTTEALRSIGLAAMEKSGRSLTRMVSERRGQLFATPDGHRVRLRTNNDRRVIVTTDDTRSDAKLDLDGCDFVLLVVPKQRRQRGQVEVYLVPFREIREAFATAHTDWLHRFREPAARIILGSFFLTTVSRHQRLILPTSGARIGLTAVMIDASAVAPAVGHWFQYLPTVRAD